MRSLGTMYERHQLFHPRARHRRGKRRYQCRAVAPLMASLIALLNQAKKKNVGFLNPFLYQNAAKGAVTDITVGTNAIQGTIKGYKAQARWDACTVLGTPDGTKILNAL